MNNIEDFQKRIINNPLNLYFCGRQECAPSYSFGPMKRHHFLLHFITKGEGTYTVGTKTYNIKENEGFIIFPGDTTFYQASGKNPWTYYWIGFDITDSDKLMTYCGLDDNNHHIIPEDGHKTRDAIIKIVEFAEQCIDTHQSRYIQLSNLYYLFSTLIKETDNAQLTEKDYMDKALDFIHKNYAYNLSITQLSKFVGIERTYLYRLFMKSRRISPQEYLIRYRLLMAKELLTQTDMPITEVALSVGFGSNSLFYKHFKQKVNMTPKEYRLHLY